MRWQFTIGLILALVLGACSESERSGNAAPEVELDTNARELRLVTTDRAGNRRKKAVYKTEDLSLLTLREGRLLARDAQGKQILSIPVANRTTEKTICSALSAML